jgi:hypothetical protein
MSGISTKVREAMAAAADTTGLPDYEGLPTKRTSIAVTNTGDGLTNAMAVEPILYAVGSTQYVVIECTVDKHGHAIIDGEAAYEVEQKFKGGVGMVVDADLVKPMIDKQRERVQLAKEKAEGTMRLAFDPDDKSGPLDDDGPPLPEAAEDGPVAGVDQLATKRKRRSTKAAGDGEA